MVGHYRIIEKIGAGGMGEVYLAEDTQLNRNVALKFLPLHLCQDDDCRKRFTREAQATAGLDHPNIAGIYEVGEYNGRPFFSMQVVEGQSLRDVVTGKDLPTDRILEIAKGDHSPGYQTFEHFDRWPRPGSYCRLRPGIRSGNRSVN
jgi:serine/threonine-protein kinase